MSIFLLLRAKYVFILLLTRALNKFNSYINFKILVSVRMLVYVSRSFPPKRKFFFPLLRFNVQHTIAAAADL